MLIGRCRGDDQARLHANIKNGLTHEVLDKRIFSLRNDLLRREIDKERKSLRPSLPEQVVQKAGLVGTASTSGVLGKASGDMPSGQGLPHPA